MMRRAVEMPPCDRLVHGLASLARPMHHPLTGLGKLAGAVPGLCRQDVGGEFPTVPQPRLRVRKKEKNLTETKPMA